MEISLANVFKVSGNLLLHLSIYRNYIQVYSYYKLQFFAVNNINWLKCGCKHKILCNQKILKTYFRDMSYFCSVLFLTVMSIDRWLAINYPTNNIAIKLRSKRSVYIISCFVWIISIGCVVRMFLESEVFGCRCSNSSYSSQSIIFVFN